MNFVSFRMASSNDDIAGSMLLSGDERRVVTKGILIAWTLYVLLSLGMWDQGTIQRIYVALSTVLCGLSYFHFTVLRADNSNNNSSNNNNSASSHVVMWLSAILHPIVLSIDSSSSTDVGAVEMYRGVWVISHCLLLEGEMWLGAMSRRVLVGLTGLLVVESVSIGFVEGLTVTSPHTNVPAWTTYGTYTMTCLMMYGAVAARAICFTSNAAASSTVFGFGNQRFSSFDSASQKSEDAGELSFVQVKQRLPSKTQSASVLQLSFGSTLQSAPHQPASQPDDTNAPQPIISIYESPPTLTPSHSNAIVPPPPPDHNGGGGLAVASSGSLWSFQSGTPDVAQVRHSLAASRISVRCNKVMVVIVSLTNLDVLPLSGNEADHLLGSKLQMFSKIAKKLAELHHGRGLWVAANECAYLFPEDTLDGYSFAFNLLGVSKKKFDELLWPKIALSIGTVLNPLYTSKSNKKDGGGLSPSMGIFPMLHQCRGMLRTIAESKHHIVADETVFEVVPWDVRTAIECDVKCYALEDDGNCTYYEINEGTNNSSHNTVNESWMNSYKSLFAFSSYTFGTNGSPDGPAVPVVETEEIVSPVVKDVLSPPISDVQRRKSRVMSMKQPPDVPNKVWRMWQQIDRNGNGELDGEEIWDMLSALGIPMTVEKYYEFLQEVDTDGNCVITLEEFMKAYKTVLSGYVLSMAMKDYADVIRQQGVDAMEQAVQLWKTYDKKGKGFISATTALEIFRTLLDGNGVNTNSSEAVEENAVHLLLKEFNPDTPDKLFQGNFLSMFAPTLTPAEIELQERTDLVTRVMYMAEKRHTVYATAAQELETKQTKFASTFRANLHMILFPYVLYVTFVTPLVAAASFHQTVQDSYLARKVVEILFDIVVVVWVLSKVFLAKTHKGKVVSDHKELRAMYMWSVEMWLDALILIPTNVISLSAFWSDYDAREVIRLNKIALVYCLNSLYSELTKNLSPSVSRITQTMGWWVIILNLLACIFLVVCRFETEESRFAVTNIHNVMEQPFFLLYATAFDWTLKLMVGLSRGASFPSDAFMVLCVVVAFVGVSSFSVIVTSVSNALNVRDAAAAFRDFMDNAQGFMDDVQLPDEAQTELIRYYRHVFETFGSTNLTYDPLSGDLPTDLMVRIRVQTTSDLFRRVEVLEPLLKHPTCTYELQRISTFQVLMPGESLCSNGDPIHAFHVVMYGRLVRMSNLQWVYPGETVNDYGILHNMKALETIQCSHDTFANILTVTKIDLLHVVGMFPDVMEEVTSTVYRRIASLISKKAQSFRSGEKKKSNRNNGASQSVELPSVSEENKSSSNILNVIGTAAGNQEGGSSDDDGNESQASSIHEFIQSHSFTNKETINLAHRSMCERIRQSVSVEDSTRLMKK
eukprot:PhF_6_TR42923/c0_g1_i2/m.65080